MLIYCVDKEKTMRKHEQISLEHYEFRRERFICENGVLEFAVE